MRCTPRPCNCTNPPWVFEAEAHPWVFQAEAHPCAESPRAPGSLRPKPIRARRHKLLRKNCLASSRRCMIVSCWIFTLGLHLSGCSSFTRWRYMLSTISKVAYSPVGFKPSRRNASGRSSWPAERWAGGAAEDPVELVEGPAEGPAELAAEPAEGPAEGSAEPAVGPAELSRSCDQRQWSPRLHSPCLKYVWHMICCGVQPAKHTRPFLIYLQ